MPLDPPAAPTAKPRIRLWLRAALASTALGIFAFAVFASTGRQDAPVEPATVGPMTGLPTPKRLAGVEVVALSPTDLVERLPLSGEVRPDRRVTISAQVDGLAGEVALLPGQPVRAGEIMMTIAPEDYRLALQSEQAALTSLQAQLQTAEATLERTARLARTGASALATLEAAQGAVDVLQAGIAAAKTRIRQAEVNLGRSTLRSPIDGIVASRSVEPGQFMQSGDAVFEVVDLSTVTVEAAVPLAFAAALHTGQTAVVWPPEDPARRIAARVARIAPQAVAGTRSTRVWLEIDNSRAGLRGGTFLKGEIELRRAENRSALPRAAIRNPDGSPAPPPAGEATGGASVLAIRDGRAVLVAVTTGPAWHGGTLIEVTGDLRADERIVALPLSGLAPGDAVEIAGN